jgi:hypothetical protein
MQLIAERTAQDYNQRKERHGIFRKTDIMPRLLRPLSTCISVWCTLI